MLLTSLFLITGTAWAQTAATYADGLYKIYWKSDNRGYLTYHEDDYPNEPQLSGVTLGDHGSKHYALDAEGIKVVWYLYTSPFTNKSYLFEATTGKFIAINPNVDSNGKGCELTLEVTSNAQMELLATSGNNAGSYMFRHKLGGISYHFCSGCGSAKNQHPVRFSTDGQSDGGNRFVFVSDENEDEKFTITDEIKNAAIAKINELEKLEGSTAENKVFYNIKNVRSGKYANYEGAGVQFTQVATPTLGSYWYLMEVADAQNVPQGYKAYRLYNAGNMLAVENPGTGNMAANDADPYPAKVYCIGKHTKDNVTGVVIRTLGEDGASWNDAGGNGAKIANHSYDDAGSIWEFEKANITESQLIQNAVAAKNAVLNTLTAEVTNTQRYFYGYKLSELEAKKAEIEAISVPDNSLVDALTNAITISKMTPFAGLERVAPKAGDKFAMDNKGRNGRLTAFAAGGYVKCQPKSSPFAYFDALWTLVATETEGQFKLYNEKLKVYIGVLANSNNTTFNYVSSATEAGVYELANVDGYATFKKVGGDQNSHLHMSNWGTDKANPYAIVRWDNGDASQWQLVKDFGPQLTTDAENPICYALRSGRDNNYYFTLDNNKVKLFNNKTVATDETTHWYFMLDGDGHLKMYSKSDNKAMGYLTGTSANTRLTNDVDAAEYDNNTYILYFAPYNQTNYNGAWFALKPSRNDTYVSNHGGTANYMGFHTAFDDGGTRIAFENVDRMRLAAKIAECEAKVVRDAIGYYSVSGGDAAAILAAAKAALQGSDIAAYRSSLAALEALTYTLNLPEVGKYYRIKNNGGTGYLSSGTGTGRTQFVADIAESTQSIFYYDGKLLSYKEGFYLNSNDNKLVYSNSSDNGVAVVFEKSRNVGKLQIKFNDNRYLFSSGTGNTDSGDTNAAYIDPTGGSPAGRNANYLFTIEEVDMTSVINELDALATDATTAASLEYLTDEEQAEFIGAAVTMATAAKILDNGGFVKDMTAEMEALDASLDAAMNVMNRFDLTTHPFRLKQTASQLYMEASRVNATIASKSEDVTNQAFNLEATETAGVYNLKSVSGDYMKVDSYGYLASADGEAANKVHEIEYIGRGKYNIKTASGYVASDEITENSNLWSDKTKDNANGIWELEPLTKSIVTYTLTDNVGNEYTGTYDQYEGISNSGPTFTGLEYTLTDKELSDNNLTATIEFSGLTFPISKPGEENWTFMKTEEMSEGVAYFYANLTANKVVTKSTKSENGKSYLPVANDDEIKKWQWAIYPAIENGKIVFTIKNRAADNFLGKENINFVTEGARFYWTACIGNGYGFSSVDNSKFFSANSSAGGEKDATLWGKTGSTHKGANLEFFTMAYTKATDATGYTTLYTPIAVAVPSGVNAFSATLNGNNTKLVLEEVERIIPANTAVLLKGVASTTYIFSESDDETGMVENNILAGATASTEATDGMYILQCQEGTPSFVEATEAVPGYNAYIMVQDGPETIGIDTSIFEAVANATTANANMDIYGLQRYYGLVQNAGTGLNGDGQIVCNHPASTSQESGNAYANLIDGSYTSFFHSGYEGSRGNGSAHYLQFALNKPVKSFRFYFKKRSQNNNNRPKEILIEGSVDGSSFEEVMTISEGLPSGGNPVDYYSDVISTTKAYGHLRFTVKKTHGDETSGNPFFTFSEFYILPTYAKVNEAFDAVRNYRASATIKTAVALNKAYAWNTGLTKGTPIVGADHFFFADTKQSDNSYVARYLYNNNGALATSTSLNAKDAKFIWTAAQPEGTEYFTLQNKGDDTKYISYGNNGNGIWVGETAVQLDIKSSYAVHSGSVGIQRVRPSGDTNGAWMVTAANGASFNRNSDKVNNGSWCSDYMFIPADLYEGLNTLTIVSNTSKADAVLAWDIYEAAAGSSILFSTTDVISDGTLRVKSCNPAYKLDGFYSDAAYTQEITALDELISDKTVYAKFVLDIFSENYGDKWVNIVRKTNANHAIILGSADENSIPTFNTLSNTNAGAVWCFVGSAENFKMYNMVSGNALALTPNANPADGVAVKMVSAADATSWHLIEKGEAFAIAPVGNDERGINSYTGIVGSQIKFYGVGDDGTQWYFTAIDAENPITLNVEVDQVWTSSPRVAELTFTINGKASQMRIEGSVPGKKMYLPVGSTYEVNSMTYRGYTYNGCINDNGVLTVSYTANDERTLYYSPRDGHPYRIPAIATAPNGDIFAICDYRPCGNDIGYGEVDLVCRVSSDNGVTWTDERTIADGLGHINDGIWKMGFGDPAIVADRESNKVLVMSVCGNRTCWDGNYGEGGENENPNRVSRLYIEHDGEKWVYGEPEEVTYDIYPLFDNKNGGEAHVASMFIGAGKICQSRVVKKGDYYRLYCSVWVVTKSIRTHHNYVIYSDDFGQTWNVLGELGYANSPAPAGNEPKCEELPDGTVVLSSRKGSGRYFNLFTFDNEGKTEEEMYTTGSWGTVASSNDIAGGLSFGGNDTNGEIYKVKAIRKEDGKICDVMLQSVPTGGDRDNVAIFYKEMEYNADGTNKYTPQTFSTGWTKGIHVSTKGSAYSTMILQADGRLGFFFEEDPSGYCMVYIPYTIEDVTDKKYSLYTVNSTISEYGVGTFYASEAMQIPEGVKAYVTNELKKEGETGVLTLTELEGIIPAKTGALIFGEEDVYEFIPSISYGTAVENNMLVGYEADNNDPNSKKDVTLSDDYTTYVLTVKDEKAGFYRKAKDFVVANNKAYLNIPTEQASNVQRIRFGKQEGTTEIDNSQLTIDNSQLVIYDLMGRPVEKMEKGIYIVNGKKVVVK